MWSRFSFVFLIFKFGYSQNLDVRVQVEEGWLEGEVLELVVGKGKYLSFKGIPYAAPPVGNLRFKAPKPPKPWDGTLTAKAHGPICMQSTPSELQDEGLDVTPATPGNRRQGTVNYRRVASESDTTGSEDCLYLNVYTREITFEPKHTIVFIHGGGFLSGSGNDQMYGPDFLVNNNVIVVTFNYRLDSLGFLCLDTAEVPGNAGLKDQVAALKWVKQNIKSFGGHEDMITVAGQSSGSASVGYHLFSKMSKGLFSRAILMSGVPFNDWSQSFEPVRRAFMLGKILNIRTTSKTKLLTFLQDRRAGELVGHKLPIMASEEVNANIFKLYDFTAVVEKDFGQERFLEEPITDLIKKKEINPVHILIGHTNEESLVDTPQLVDTEAAEYDWYPELLVPTKIQLGSKPGTVLAAADKIYSFYFGDQAINVSTIKQYCRYITDSGFVYDVHKFAAKLAGTGVIPKLYYYIFSYESERNYYSRGGKEYGMHGAAHGDDMVYLFDPKAFNLTLDTWSREYEMIMKLVGLITVFAEKGEPTYYDMIKDGAVWKPFTSSSQTYVEIFGDRYVVGERYNGDIIDFWDNVYKEAGVEV